VNLAAIVAALMTHRYRDCAGEGWRLGEKKMRHLLTTLAAAAFVGFAIAPAHAAPLPQLNGPGNQASPVEKVGYYGTAATATTRATAITGVTGITGPITDMATTGRIVMAIGTGPIIGAGGSLLPKDQDRSASRRS